MSATIRPGMLNSASSRPAHIRSTANRESGPQMRKSITWRSPVKVRERQSTDWTSVSKILSRGAPERAMSARKSAAAAADMGILFIAGLPPDRRERARWLRAAGRGHCEDRRRIADLRAHLVQTGTEPCHYGAGIFLLL